MLEPKDWKEFSESLEEWNSCPEELVNVKTRTIANRLYYYIFLSFREIIREKLPGSLQQVLDSQKGRIHKLVIRILFLLNFRIEADALKSLRDIRNSVDYDLHLLNESEQLEEARLLVEELERLIPILKNLQESRVQSAVAIATGTTGVSHQS